jgi:anti-sigma factor RsiW
MRLRRRGNDHVWSQQHLSHYVEGDMSWRARRRLELHAEECPDCSLGIRALRALRRLLHASVEVSDTVRAPAGIFDRVRADAAPTETRSQEVDEV